MLFPADSVTFTEEILNEKLHSLCNANIKSQSSKSNFFRGASFQKKTYGGTNL